MSLLALAIGTAALLVTVPVVMLALECLAGAWVRRGRHHAGEPPPISVLMAAHDEAAGIGEAIRAVLSQLRVRDELIVVADNCSDDTAAVARALGAQVVERHDPVRRGKGFALEAGCAALTDGPGRIVIVVDADCMPMPHALRHLAMVSSRRRAVVQGAYLLMPPDGAPAIVRISAFAFLVKNLVRQIGLRRLTGAALLQGSGMAFPLPLFRQLDWRGESLVEDLDMGIRLLAAGQAVTFDENAVFLSATASFGATAGQRRRWEHGMMQSMLRNMALLLRAAIRRPRLFVVALDQMIPPAVVLIAVALLLLSVSSLAGAWNAALLLFAALSVLGASLALVWVRFRRQLGGGMTLAEVGRYLWWKLPLAVQFVTRRERQWVRTEREP